MSLSLLYLIFGLVLLFAGGEGLVRGSARLAVRLGLTPLMVGLTVVAFGTSAPELVVSASAALKGLGDIAIGNVVGSNILNIGLILGITTLICPLKVQLQIIRVDTPILIVITGLAVWALADRNIDRVEGALLTVGLIAYVSLTVYLARKETITTDIASEFQEGVPLPQGSVWRDLLYIAAGLILLVFGSRFLVSGATDIARQFGISEVVIGLTIVSVGTSMPELATSVVAALKKEPDIALGNIVGSNVFNALGILGISALIKPLNGPGISWTDLMVAIAFTVALLPIVWTHAKVHRWEGGLLLAGYAAYLIHLWPK